MKEDKFISTFIFSKFQCKQHSSWHSCKVYNQKYTIYESFSDFGNVFLAPRWEQTSSMLVIIKKRTYHLQYFHLIGLCVFIGLTSYQTSFGLLISVVLRHYSSRLFECFLQRWESSAWWYLRKFFQYYKIIQKQIKIRLIPWTCHKIFKEF